MKVDLTTQYLGLQLANPLVVASSPLTARMSNLKALAEAGAAAVVLPSLFEEQIDMEHGLGEHLETQGTESSAEATTYFPRLNEFTVSLKQYLELIKEARQELKIPIIASLNGVTSGGWSDIAQEMESAGAHALELNLYSVAADPDRSGAEVEQNYIDIVKHVRPRIKIPLSVKVSSNFSSPANMAKRFCEAGADGLVLFNRFYQPDFDLEEMEVVPRLELSRTYDMLLPLTWVSILFDRVKADLALTGGVRDHIDVAKSMMAGARVVQVASQLLMRGPGGVREILASLAQWMEAKEYTSIAQMQGSMSQKRAANPSAFLRANYLKVLQSWRSKV